jgi:hypothetical protein
VLLPRPRSRCGCAPRPTSRDDKRTARSVSRVRGVVVGYATPRPPAERLQVACSGWEGRPHRCPRSHASPGRISAPHRQQWTTPASTWVDHWRRSARWVAPYRSPRWALRLRSLLRRQLSQRVAVVSVSPHSRQGRSIVVHRPDATLRPWHTGRTVLVIPGVLFHVNTNHQVVPPFSCFMAQTATSSRDITPSDLVGSP